jgi:hypothetical protein
MPDHASRRTVTTFGRPTEPLPFDENDEDADLRVRPDETTQDKTARHAGRVDIVRELIDGMTGDHKRT